MPPPFIACQQKTQTHDQMQQAIATFLQASAALALSVTCDVMNGVRTGCICHMLACHCDDDDACIENCQ